MPFLPGNVQAQMKSLGSGIGGHPEAGLESRQWSGMRTCVVARHVSKYVGSGKLPYRCIISLIL